MTYEEYINSNAWRVKRAEIIKRDGGCVVCGDTENLEVHHKSYKNLFSEPLSDLVTLCKYHHEAITNADRKRKYAKRKIKPDEYKSIVTERKDRNEKADGNLQNSRGIPAYLAQRPNRRPIEQVFKTNQGD